MARNLTVTTRTIRFYEERGLITPVRNGAQRTFSYEDRDRLLLILRGKNLGFTLEEIGEFLALHDARPGQNAQTRALLAKIDAHIARLEHKRDDLDRTLRELVSIREACLAHRER